MWLINNTRTQTHNDPTVSLASFFYDCAVNRPEVRRTSQRLADLKVAPSSMVNIQAFRTPLCDEVLECLWGDSRSVFARVRACMCAHTELLR